MIRFKDIVNTIRSARSLLNIPAQATLTIWVKDAMLPRALTALTRAEVKVEETKAMKRFPLAEGGYVGIASEHITDASIALAKGKLDTSITELQRRIAQLQKLLTNMAEKAPTSVIEEKKELLGQLTAQAEETRRSRDTLK
jgi:valyl-tRNA synthetase